MSALSKSASTVAVSGGRKRAWDALERRFAAAKVGEEEQLKENEKKTRRTTREDNGRKEPKSRDDEPSIAHPPPHQHDVSAKIDSGTHPIYLELSQTVDPSLLMAAPKVPSRGETVNKVITDILQSGDKGYKYAKGSLSVKYDNWILLDNFVPKSHASSDARIKALKCNAKRSQKHMSLRQHRKCGSFDLPKEFHKFDLFKQMHEMWKEYIIELLKGTKNKQLAQCLLAADLHGAFLLVVECKTSAFKGVNGIMIRETAETFGMITPENRFQVVPKKGSVFILQAGCWKITLYGDKLSPRDFGT